MKTNNTLLLILIVMVIPQWSHSQHMLEDYIQQGLKSNLQLQQEQLNYERSLTNLTLAKAMFLPSISANATYQLANGGRKIAIPLGDLMNPVYTTLNQITKTTNFPNIQNASTSFLANNFHDTKVRIVENLINPEIYFNYKAQKELISVQQAQKKAYENELKYNISNAYYQFLKTEDAGKILRETRSLLMEILKVNQKFVDYGKATRDVVLNTEYELSQIDQQLADNDKNNQVSKSYFNFLLNRNFGEKIERDSLLYFDDLKTAEISALSTTAIEQRQDLKQVVGGIRVNDQLVRLSRNSSFLPKVVVVGDVGYQGFNYIMDNSQQYWLVQFGMSWDIFKGGENRAKIQRAQIEYNLMENRMQQLKKQIEMQVIQSYYEIGSAGQLLFASGSGLKSAEKTFQIVKSKYLEGQALLVEYLDAQNKLTNARLTQSINSFELLIKQASLQKTISNL